MFGGDAPDSLAFVDYKKNAKQFLSEKEFARFAAAADNFVMPSNPYSATLDNQYLYLSEGNAIKLFLKNTDRFVPMLSRLVLQRFFDPDVLPPPDSTIMVSLGQQIPITVIGLSGFSGLGFPSCNLFSISIKNYHFVYILNPKLSLEAA